MLREIADFRDRLIEYYQDYENRTVAFWTIGISAAASFILFCLVLIVGHALGRAFSDETTITVAHGNPCITQKGLIRTNAPSSCYDDNLPHEVVSRADETPYTLANKVAKDSASGYNPPCVKDGLPGCTDKVYGKRFVTGIIDTVTFHDTEKQTADGHLQPDYTEVEFYQKFGDSASDEEKERFCGNVLDRFTPGTKFKLVLNESKHSDYNGCYTVDVVVLTFGGDRHVATGVPSR